MNSNFNVLERMRFLFITVSFDQPWAVNLIMYVYGPRHLVLLCGNYLSRELFSLISVIGGIVLKVTIDDVVNLW